MTTTGSYEKRKMLAHNDVTIYYFTIRAAVNLRFDVEAQFNKGDQNRDEGLRAEEEQHAFRWQLIGI